MKSFATVQRKLKELENERKKVLAAKMDIIRRYYILCATCGVKSRLSRWVFIQDQYYVQPYSCNGGAYWKNYATQNCHILCPKCGTADYLFNHPQRDKIVNLTDSREFVKYDLFSEVKISQG